MSGEISRPQAILLAHVIYTAMVAGAGAIFPLLQLDPERLVYPACVLLGASFAWILWSWFILRQTLFEPYALFMIAAGLFNGGQALLEIFGLNPGGILNGRSPADLVTKALYLVALSALCLHAGALFAFNRKRVRVAGSESAAERDKGARTAGLLLLGIAIFPTLSLVKGSFDLVMDYGYLGLYKQQTAVSISFALSGFLLPAIAFLLAGSRASRGLQLFCLALVSLYCGVYLFLGLRAAAAMACVSIAWVFESSIRRIPRLLIVFLALAALALFPLIRQTRNTSGRDRLSLQNQIETASNLESPVASSIAEMGYTLVTVAHTIALAPETRPFDLGSSYLYALIAIVPNLGWDVHPSVVHGLLCDWLIGAVDPVIARSGGGLGFSFIAESYLNFGWFGGPLWLGLIGYGMTSLFLAADGGDSAKRAFVGSFLSFFFVFARGESAIVARGLVWYALLPYLLATALAFRQRRKARP